jgi:hypothetical protein
MSLLVRAEFETGGQSLMNIRCELQRRTCIIAEHVVGCITPEQSMASCFLHLRRLIRVMICDALGSADAYVLAWMLSYRIIGSSRIRGVHQTNQATPWCSEKAIRPLSACYKAFPFDVVAMIIPLTADSLRGRARLLQGRRMWHQS